MRYSMIKAATVALFGLTNVFLGVNASPIGGYEVQERSAAYEDNKLVARTKAVPKLEDYKYVATAGPCLPRKPCLWKVTKDGVSGTIDLIKIDTTEQSITVEDANNEEDKSANKLHLSDIEMSLFVYKGGKQVSDLKIVRAQPVVNKATKAAIAAGYKTLGLKDTETLTVTSTSSGKEKEVYDSLLKTPFGKNVAFLHSDFGAGQITSFVVTDGVVQPTLTMHLG